MKKKAIRTVTNVAIGSTDVFASPVAHASIGATTGAMSMTASAAAKATRVLRGLIQLVEFVVIWLGRGVRDAFRQFGGDVVKVARTTGQFARDGEWYIDYERMSAREFGRALERQIDHPAFPSTHQQVRTYFMSDEGRVGRIMLLVILGAVALLSWEWALPEILPGYLGDAVVGCGTVIAIAIAVIISDLRGFCRSWDREVPTRHGRPAN